VPGQRDDATLQERMEALAGERFNSCLLNLYRDGRDAMGWHSDNEALYGPAPTIGALPAAPCVLPTGLCTALQLMSGRLHCVLSCLSSCQRQIEALALQTGKHAHHTSERRAAQGPPRLARSATLCCAGTRTPPSSGARRWAPATCWSCAATCRRGRARVLCRAVCIGLPAQA